MQPVSHRADLLEALYSDSFQLLMSVLVALLTAARILSAHMLLMWLLCPLLVRRLLADSLCTRSPTGTVFTQPISTSPIHASSSTQTSPIITSTSADTKKSYQNDTTIETKGSSISVNRSRSLNLSVVLNLIAFIFPFHQHIYVASEVVNFFMAILERTGSISNSEIFMSLLVFITVSIPTLAFVCYIYYQFVFLLANSLDHLIF